MKFSKILVVFVVLVALVASQTIYDIEAEPWKYDPDFDEDKPYTWKRFAVYTPKGWGLDSMPMFKQWLENDAAKFSDLELYTKNVDPYVRFWNSTDQVFDDINIVRHDAREINKLLVELGAKYDDTLTWDLRSNIEDLRESFFNPKAPIEDL